MFNKLNPLESKDIPSIKEDNNTEIAEDNSQIPSNHKSETVEETELENGDNWYDRWRKDNL